MPYRAPVIALSHGGGPLPLLNDPAHTNITTSMRTRVPQILHLNNENGNNNDNNNNNSQEDAFPYAPPPRAIIVVTAHWQEKKVTISSGKKHRLLYDYYGFPREAYSFEYDAPGSPEVAREVESAVKEVGLDVELDEERGWDHGVFVPLLLIHPAATIPIVQISLLEDESPQKHILLGRALSTLRASNIAIICSGFASLHNMRILLSDPATRDKRFKKKSEEWNEAVTKAVGIVDDERRAQEVARWREWPGSYEMHPRGGAEHFLPLVVACGAADGNGDEDNGVKWYTDEFMGLDMVSYYWD